MRSTLPKRAKCMAQAACTTQCALQFCPRLASSMITCYCMRQPDSSQALCGRCHNAPCQSAQTQILWPGHTCAVRAAQERLYGAVDALPAAAAMYKAARQYGDYLRLMKKWPEEAAAAHVWVAQQREAEGNFRCAWHPPLLDERATDTALSP